MILPPLAEDYNEGFPTIPHTYFDDHQVKREHALQLRLKQLAPTILDGGRAILWYCHMCQKPWYELGRTASFVCLSKSQLAEIAQQLGVEMHPVSHYHRQFALCAHRSILAACPGSRSIQTGKDIVSLGRR